MAPTELGAAQGDDRIRLARGLVMGLEAMPGVQRILVPCLPSAGVAMSRLFEDAMRPGRLMSPKLELVFAGRDSAFHDVLAGKIRGRQIRLLERLAAIGGTPDPRSWKAALKRLAVEPRRPCGWIRRIFKLARLSLASRVADAALGILRLLPPPHAGVVADLRRRKVSATWFLIADDAATGRRLPGPKILECTGVGQSDGRHLVATGAMLHRLVRAGGAIVAPSRHAASITEACADGLPVTVVPPAPLASELSAGDGLESRQRSAEELRELFSGGDASPLHRHFCDFPFEQVDYVVAARSRETTGILPAYATVLRRHRRNLKLLVDGRLPQGKSPLTDVAALGLSFDVAEAVGLGEAARLRLLRHARLVVAADLEGWCLPTVFAEAIAAGTPVVMARAAAVREMIPDTALAWPEYFDPGADVEAGLVRSILHVIDHRDEVLSRQRQLLRRLMSRTWQDVVEDTLRLVTER